MTAYTTDESIADERCTETRIRGFMGFVGGGAAGAESTVQCRKPKGHDGKHHGSFKPMPGFADEHIWWTT